MRQPWLQSSPDWVDKSIENRKIQESKKNTERRNMIEIDRRGVIQSWIIDDTNNPSQVFVFSFATCAYSCSCQTRGLFVCCFSCALFCYTHSLCILSRCHLYSLALCVVLLQLPYCANSIYVFAFTHTHTHTHIKYISITINFQS